jgi:hypothetical protein
VRTGGIAAFMAYYYVGTKKNELPPSRRRDIKT